MGSHFLLQGIFPAQGSNSCTFHWQVDFYQWTTREACCPIINNYKNRGNKWNNSFSYTGQQAAQACASMAREASEVSACSGLLHGGGFQDTRDTGRTQWSHWIEERSSGTLMKLHLWDRILGRTEALKENPREICRGIPSDHWLNRDLHVYFFYFYFFFWSSCLDETPETEQRITLKQRPLNTQNSNRARAYTRHRRESSEGNHPHRGDRVDFRLQAALTYLKKAEKQSSKGSVWFQPTNCVSGQRSILLKEYNNI